MTLGVRSSTGSDNEVQSDGGPAGGVVGTIGGNGDSIALWIAIAVLGFVAVSAYPAQRKVRLAWNSWRGSNGTSRNGKGRDMCVKISEWE